MTKKYMELWQENQELKKKIKVLEEEKSRIKEQIVDVSGWKGKDELEINRDEDVWHIVEHRKDKKTGDVDETTNTVSHMSVRVLYTIIKRLTDLLEITKYREIVPELITHYEWGGVDVDSFNGGQNRAKFYFPYYYYPMKVLEHLKYVDYGGRGTVKRLK